MIPAPAIQVKAPAIEVKDSPRGRRMVYLKAQGLSNNEISKLEGITIQQVSLIVRQPWFQQTLAQILHMEGIESIRAKALAYGATAMDKAFEMMHDASSENVKAQCAFQLMKIGIGETQNLNVKKDSSELDPMQLEAEIKRREEELQNLQKPKGA